ncbi:DUF2802 domain-containing protein [Simiduia aestuariiviva]|uniref:DUF2802 domain-containing protein n=1 Tax=Simiduia aestuariiviva TaxID=1510459 RepID=A0A839UJV6_9GAMM|nr:DUF2802 domain-containing protein [Simiduia aestuariiviva]MBB3168394.1 hypothetical protein [Simiduia aestuariiviva]
MQSIISQFTSLEAILAGVVIISWVAVSVALLSLMRVKRQEVAVRDAMEELKQTVTIGNNGLIGMGRKLLSIEKNMQRQKRNQLKEPQKPAAAPVPRASIVNMDSHYQQAGEMLAQGLTAGQVANATGMSQAEVQLLAMLRTTATEPVS